MRFFLPLTSFLISNIIKSYRYNAYNDSFLNNHKRPPIFALLHFAQMLVASYRAPFKINILVSLSRDGEIAAETLKRLGFGIVRGSSSKRGKEALNELVSIVNKGESAAITVDGPRGPSGEVKGGIIRLSQLTKVPIVCVSAASKPMFRLNRSWDRFALAPPFAKIVICFSNPIFIEDNIDETKFDSYKRLIKEELESLSKKSYKMLYGY